jgi:hypothetical protein
MDSSREEVVRTEVKTLHFVAEEFLQGRDHGSKWRAKAEIVGASEGGSDYAPPE